MPPTTGLLCFVFVFEKKTFEVDASINANTQKMGTLKTNDVNNDARDNATNNQYPSTMKPPQTPPFSPETLPPQLPVPAPAPPPPLSLITIGGADRCPGVRIQ